MESIPQIKQTVGVDSTSQFAPKFKLGKLCSKYMILDILSLSGKLADGFMILFQTSHCLRRLLRENYHLVVASLNQYIPPLNVSSRQYENLYPSVKLPQAVDSRHFTINEKDDLECLPLKVQSSKRTLSLTGRDLSEIGLVPKFVLGKLHSKYLILEALGFSDYFDISAKMLYMTSTSLRMLLI